MSTIVDPFEMTASSSEGGDFERPSPGMYPAVLVAVIDLGTHTRVFSGEAKKSRKIYLAWDLVNENDSKGRTFVVSQDYTFSLNVKAKYRALIEGWTGKAMAEGQRFNVTELVGKPCCLTISEGVSGAGKKFSEIAAVGPVMKGLVVGETERVPFVWSITSIHSANDLPEIPEWLPRIYGKTVADEIRASDEYGNLPNF